MAIRQQNIQTYRDGAFYIHNIYIGTYMYIYLDTAAFTYSWVIRQICPNQGKFIPTDLDKFEQILINFDTFR